MSVKITALYSYEDGSSIEAELPREFESMGHAETCIHMAKSYWNDWKNGNTQEIRDWAMEVLYNTGMVDFSMQVLNSTDIEWEVK